MSDIAGIISPGGGRGKSGWDDIMAQFEEAIRIVNGQQNQSPASQRYQTPTNPQVPSPLGGGSSGPFVPPTQGKATGAMIGPNNRGIGQAPLPNALTPGPGRPYVPGMGAPQAPRPQSQAEGAFIGPGDVPGQSKAEGAFIGPGDVPPSRGVGDYRPRPGQTVPAPPYDQTEGAMIGPDNLGIGEPSAQDTFGPGGPYIPGIGPSTATGEFDRGGPGRDLDSVPTDTVIPQVGSGSGPDIVPSGGRFPSMMPIDPAEGFPQLPPQPPPQSEAEGDFIGPEGEPWQNRSIRERQEGFEARLPQLKDDARYGKVGLAEYVEERRRAGASEDQIDIETDKIAKRISADDAGKDVDEKAAAGISGKTANMKDRLAEASQNSTNARRNNITIHLSNMDTAEKLAEADSHSLSGVFDRFNKGTAGGFSEGYKAYADLMREENVKDGGAPMVTEDQKAHYILGSLLSHLRSVGSDADAADLVKILQDYSQVFDLAGTVDSPGDRVQRQARMRSELETSLTAIRKNRHNPAWLNRSELAAQQLADQLIIDKLKKPEKYGPSAVGAAADAVGGAISGAAGAVRDAGAWAWQALPYTSKTDAQLMREQGSPWWHDTSRDLVGEKKNLDKLMATLPGVDDENNYRQWIEWAQSPGQDLAPRDMASIWHGHYGETNPEWVKGLVDEMSKMKSEGVLKGANLDEEMSIAYSILRDDDIPGVGLARSVNGMDDPRIVSNVGKVWQQVDSPLAQQYDMPPEYDAPPGPKGQYPTQQKWYAPVAYDRDGKLVKPGDATYPKGLESQGMILDEDGKPTTILPTDKLRKMEADQAKEFEAQGKAEEKKKSDYIKNEKARIKQVEADTIADYEKKYSPAALRASGPGGTGGVLGGSIQQQAHALAVELVSNETNALVAQLNSDEAILEFSRIVSESLAGMGEAMTQYAAGVRPDQIGVKEYVPESILLALQSTGAKKEAALMRLSTFAMSGHLFPTGTSVESMRAQIPLLSHSQGLKQRSTEFAANMEFNTWQANLNYHEKILGHKLSAQEKAIARDQWERTFKHTRQKDADAYSLARAKANLENAGHLRLDRLELETIEGLLTTIDMGEQVLREKPQYGTGWFKNIHESLGNYLGWGSPSWHRFKQLVTTQLNTYVNRLTGKQLSKHEVGRLKGAVPQITDDDAIFTAKAKAFIQIQRQILQRKLRVYAMNGHDVTPFEGDMKVYYKMPNGAERSSTLTQMRSLLSSDPSLVGRLKLMTGLGGRVVRPGDDYLGDLIGGYLVETEDGSLRYNEEKYGAVRLSKLPLGVTPQGYHFGPQGAIRAGQRGAAARFIPKL